MIPLAFHFGFTAARTTCLSRVFVRAELSALCQHSTCLAITIGSCVSGLPSVSGCVAGRDQRLSELGRPRSAAVGQVGTSASLSLDDQASEFSSLSTALAYAFGAFAQVDCITSDTMSSIPRADWAAHVPFICAVPFDWISHPRTQHVSLNLAGMTLRMRK